MKGHAARRNQTFVRRGQRRRRLLERLEKRLLLSADGIGDTGGLAISEDVYDSSSVLVRFHPGSRPEGSAESDVELLPGLWKVGVDSDTTVDQTLQSLDLYPGLVFAEPNFQVSVSAQPGDPQYQQLWGMNNAGQTGGTPGADINAEGAWELTTGQSTTIVAVVDTGVDYLHEDLAANMWVNSGEVPGDNIDNDGNGYIDDVYGYDFANNDGDPMDDHFHGTHVAGTIGAVANNGVGVAGVSWNVQLMAVKFLTSSGSGSISAAVNAIQYAVDNDATISNHSWGFNGGYSQSLADAIEYARSEDHLVIAAAGNGGGDRIGDNNDLVPFFPGNFTHDNLLAVAATDHNDELGVFSNFGKTQVDVGAPGVDIYSTMPGNTYDTLSGTSMATPHVSGVAALVRSEYPQWSYSQVRDQIFDTVDPIAALQGVTTTGGRVNAAAAVTPDISGPAVVSSSPNGDSMRELTEWVVTFDEKVDGSSFTLDDIVSLNGPQGAVQVESVAVVPDSQNRQFAITVPEQTALGLYSLVIGPDIFDKWGNAMDQDGNGVNGDSDSDRYTATVNLIPDTVGPFIVSSTPEASINTSIDRVEITFDEKILDGSFSVDDVLSISGPGGPIPVNEVNAISQSVYEITFPNQNTLGHYSIEIGSSIFDRSGNPLDQDQDGIGGELEDGYQIDFDMERWLYASEVVDYSSQFTSTNWAASQALGAPDTFEYGDIVTAWAPGVENGREEFLTVAFETPLLASGVSIRETFGNGFVTRVEVRNEISGEYVTVSTETDPSPADVPYDYLVTWPITDFPVDAVRITVDTDHDLDAYEEIDSVQLRGLDVPDVDGARIVSSTLQGSVQGSVDRFVVAFDEAIRDGTFTLDDISQFVGPEGEITPTAINRLSGSEYEVVFPEQSGFGDYSLLIGPDILDLDDLPMNQDRDSLDGEPSEDQFSVSFRIELWQFADSVMDFSSQYSGTSWSAANALGASDTFVYGDSRDAWSPSSINGSAEFLTVGFETPLIANSVVIRESFGNGYVTQVEARDAETGEFVIVFSGPDLSEPGTVVDNIVSWSPLANPVDAVRISVDTDHSASYEQIDSVQLRGVIAPDLRGPSVVGNSPVGGAPGPLGRFELEFSEPIDASSFGLDDVARLEGPNGSIAPSAIVALSETRFAVEFEPQTVWGSYWLEVGPGISDLAGNEMDQDGDSLNGTVDDRFSMSVELEYWQFASEIVDFSSEYSIFSWSASEVLGPSDTLSYGDARTAWAPKGTNGTTEFVAVSFATPVLATGVVIRETFGNGFVRSIEIRDAETGVFYGVPEFVDDSQPGEAVDFSVSWPRTEFAVDAVRVTIDTDQSTSSEEIDSIQLRGVVAPDSKGPSVIGTTPSAGAAGPIDHVDIVFSEPIDPDSFTVDDVTSFFGPDGVLVASEVETLAVDRYRIHFPAQETFGSYSMTLGPGITDESGNLMDQDLNGVSGQPSDDFVLAFDLELWQFATEVVDFSSQYSATSWSAAAALGPADTFSYGDHRTAWAPKVTNGSLEFLTVGFDTPMQATGVIIRETFGNGFVRTIEVRNATTGEFLVMPFEGDSSVAGAPVDFTVSWPMTDYEVDAVRITIDTSQTFSSEEIDAVTLRGIVPPDVTGPRVVLPVSGETVPGPIDHIDLVFSEPIDESTLTLEDIESFDGPEGPIAVSSVSKISDDQFRLNFDVQDSIGNFSLVVGPGISDLAGNLLDQDGDGIQGGESDRVIIEFSTELWQYASSVVDYSSQYSWPSWSASQALGESDTLVYGDKRTAWAPKSTNGTTEHLTLGFETPVHSTGAVIRETFGNGFVRMVELRDSATGVFHVMPIAGDDSQPGLPVDFSVNWEQTEYLADAIRITIDTSHSLRSEEIDSVRLRGLLGN